MLLLHWGKSTKLSWRSTLAFATKMCSWGKIIIKRKKNSKKNKKKNPGVFKSMRESETVCTSNRLVIRLRIWNLSHSKGVCSPKFFSWPKLPFPRQSKGVQGVWEVQGTSSQFPADCEEEPSGGSYSNHWWTFEENPFKKQSQGKQSNFFFFSLQSLILFKMPCDSRGLESKISVYAQAISNFKHSLEENQICLSKNHDYWEVLIRKENISSWLLWWSTVF